MNDLKNNFVKTALALLGKFFIFLKKIFADGFNYFFKMESGRELNKPPVKEIISPRQRNFMVTIQQK
jgi:hypothetical protein